MKSEVVEADRNKTESRQSIHCRKMSKNSSIVNGADESLSSYVAEDESVVRQINLAAAFHDHISCTKSAELCKIDGTREARISLPCETDHIYANCSEMKTKTPILSAAKSPPTLKELSAEIKKLRSVIYVQLELIKQLEAEIAAKDSEILSHKQETDSLRAQLVQRERMCLLRKRCHKSSEESLDLNISESKKSEPEVNVSVATASTTVMATSVMTAPTTTATTTINTALASPLSAEHSSTIPPVNLVTRYFGRRSKTIPSRALKRRYLGPPKTIPNKTLLPKSFSSATSVSSESEIQDDEMVPKPETSKETKTTREKSSLIDIKKISKRRGKKPKGISRKMDFLTTDKAYFLPDNQISQSSVVCPETLIDVPSWKFKPVTSFYQMEGTENINDPVFQRRHLKCEQDERRRKRWDIQRLREQKACEKLKYKNSRVSSKESENNVQQKSQSFYPDPRHIQYIEVTDQLPVLAFGHLIPLFQPSEFSLSWKSGTNLKPEPTESCPVKMAKKGRLSSTGPKVT